MSTLTKNESEINGVGQAHSLTSAFDLTQRVRCTLRLSPWDIVATVIYENSRGTRALSNATRGQVVIFRLPTTRALNLSTNVSRNDN